MTTTLRSDTVLGLKALLDGFSAANAGMLNACLRSRPASFGNRPLAFVGPRNERIDHTGQNIFQRQPQPTVVFLWAPSADQMELADVRDDIIDAFIAYAEPRPHAISNLTTCTPVSVEDVELELDGSFYPACVVTFQVFAGEGTL